MESWLSEARAAYTQQGDRFRLASLFALDSPSFSHLRAALNSTPHLRPASYASLTRSFFADYRPWADFLASWLLFVRDADLDSQDPITATNAYQLLEDAYRGADRVFAQGDTGWFVPTLRKLTVLLVNLALKAGRISGDQNLTKAGEAARILGRPMGVAAGDRSTESPSKRDALLFLANSTFKVYFALSNLRLCDTIISNIQSATNSLEHTFPKADRVTFSYYRGRILLYQRRLPQARHELQKAFDLCHADSWSNARLILTYLIVAFLPLGYIPSDDLLQEFDLNEQYENLIAPLLVGDWTNVLAALDEWKTWHLKKGNYLLLREKLEVICWRNLARRTLFVTTSGTPRPPSGPPTLSLHALLTTARIAFSDPSLDVDDIESMCASLMDQGYIKAYILHSKRLLVLQKGPLVGFPKVSTVNP